MWSRPGKDLTDHVPDVAKAATAAVASGTVLDWELVTWHGARLDYDLLQRRLVNRSLRTAALAVEHPAPYAAFDVLDVGGRGARAAAAGAACQIGEPRGGLVATVAGVPPSRRARSRRMPGLWTTGPRGSRAYVPGRGTG
jgi:hypothetical protein